MMPFITLPEIQVDKALLLSVFQAVDESYWLPQMTAGHYRCEVPSFPELDRIADQFSSHVPLHKNPVRCMKFSPGCKLEVHTDNPRTCVIQIPLSSNCSSTPTWFHDDLHQKVASIDWADNQARMFDTRVPHSMHNNTDEVRYMLYVPFFPPTTFELLRNIYLSGNFFK